MSTSSIALAWGPVPTATSYTVRRLSSGIFSPLQTLAGTAYTDTGLNPSTLYTYTVSAINAFGEGPQSVPASATTNAVPSNSIQMTPGHWVTVDRGSGQSAAQQIAFINSLSTQVYIVGVVLAGLWGEFDGGTSGPNYSTGDTLVDSWAAACASAGKKLIIRIDWSRFTTAVPSGPLGCCPSYFVPNSSTQPSYTLRPAGATWAGNLATSASYWYGPTMDAFIALIQHLGGRYGTNIAVEGMRFSETASAAPTSVGNTTSNAITQWKRLMPAARAAWPGKEISIGGNYLGADSDTLGMITAGIASQVLCTAGPDSGPQRSFQFNQVFNGYLNGAKTGTDYRGIFPNISENQYPNEASGGNSSATTPQLLWQWQQLSGSGAGNPAIGGAMNPNKFLWQQSTYTGPAPGGYSYFTWPQVLSFINSIQGACNTILPPGFISGSGATPIFSFPSGFAGASGQMNSVWEATPSGSSILLTQNVAAHQAGGSWYTPAKVPVSVFTAFGTFKQTAIAGSSTQMCCFVLQNSTSAKPAASGSNAFGTNATADANLGGLGAYSFQNPITPSVGIKFDMSGANGQNNYPAGVLANTVGLYINGGNAGGMVPDIDLNPSGINLHLGNVMSYFITYDGAILTLVLQDTSTLKQFRQSWPINIPAIVGATAWVGWTGGNVTPQAGQLLSSMSYSSGINARLSPPIFSLGSGLYTSTQSVSITGPAGAQIYYTTNGRQPTRVSTPYTGPITVSTSMIIQAVAIAANFTDSFVSTANYQIGLAGTPVINFPSGFASSGSLLALNGAASLSGTSLTLTDGTTSQEAGSAFYWAPVTISTFSTRFQVKSGAGQTNGMTFCLQAQPAASLDGSILHVSGGPNTVGVNFGFGYSGSTNGSGGSTAGILASMAFKLDFNNNAIGVYLNGAPPTTPQTSVTGIGLNSGHPLTVALSYNGTNLTGSITDQTTSAVFSFSFPVNIPAAVGGATAWAGFTGGTGFNAGLQQVLSWTM